VNNLIYKHQQLLEHVDVYENSISKQEPKFNINALPGEFAMFIFSQSIFNQNGCSHAAMVFLQAECCHFLTEDIQH